MCFNANSARAAEYTAEEVSPFSTVAGFAFGNGFFVSQFFAGFTAGFTV
jgi:hypothetical protein